ncbi:hypothetical protein ACFVSS_06905 [Peribacillus butanolivorans]|uniref:hypothetical protein n=1 Tax=Peribacillus butanolivorans TaxID=421767 RepID=UPI0036DDCC8E
MEKAASLKPDNHYFNPNKMMNIKMSKSIWVEDKEELREEISFGDFENYCSEVLSDYEKANYVADIIMKNL